MSPSWLRYRHRLPRSGCVLQYLYRELSIILVFATPNSILWVDRTCRLVTTCSTFSTRDYIPNTREVLRSPCEFKAFGAHAVHGGKCVIHLDYTMLTSTLEEELFITVQLLLPSVPTLNSMFTRCPVKCDACHLYGKRKDSSTMVFKLTGHYT